MLHFTNCGRDSPDILFAAEELLWQSAVVATTYNMPHYHWRSTLIQLLPYVYKEAVNTSFPHLFSIETCCFGFPSRLLLMGAVVITACRPSGVSGLILVPNSPSPRLSSVSVLLSSHGESWTWRNTFKTTEICIGVPWNWQMCAVYIGWVGDLGALDFNTAPTRCATLWSSPPTEGERDVWQGFLSPPEKSNRDNQKYNSIVTKYLRLVFFPHPLSQFLSIFQLLWCVSMRTARQSR